ncbi:MAG TPA: YdcF family protein [Alphaproteobacteria bacterium]|nr:YdcF family protein [Alphaproteobacteria bacterium]
MLRRLLWLVVVLWCIGLGAFITGLPDIPASRPIGPDEGIVVPTGGAERVATGFDLLAAGGKRLLITGVHPDTTLAALEVEAGRHADPCCVDLDHAAPDTIGNAASARAWVAEHGIGKVRLVTSWYHMPRSLVLFERAMPDAVIIPHPVFPANPPRAGWWRSWLGWRLITAEYNKLLWAWASPEPEQ